MPVPASGSIGEHGRVFTSKTPDGGTDLSFAAGRRFARQHGLEDVFLHEFDGTPGSLTLGLDDMQARYGRLIDEDRAGVAASRLLDTVKLLYVGGQTDFRQRLVRAAAEQIRGDGPISAKTWEWLCRRTQEEGFGGFNDDGDFQTYDPYMERCVAYTPTPSDLNCLAALLREHGDSQGLAYLASASDQRDALLDSSMRRLKELQQYLRRMDLVPSPADRLLIEVSTALRPQLAGLGDHLASLPGTDNARLAYSLTHTVDEVQIQSARFMHEMNVVQDIRSQSPPLSEMAANSKVLIHDRNDLLQAVERLRHMLMQLQEAVDL